MWNHYLNCASYLIAMGSYSYKSVVLFQSLIICWLESSTTYFISGIIIKTFSHYFWKNLHLICLDILKYASMLICFWQLVLVTLNCTYCFGLGK